MTVYRTAGVLILIASLLPVGAFASDVAGEVTIHRDTWGVPYIYASTDADAAYGLGYAMAEDRLGDLYINVRTAIGNMAEAFGPEHITQDYALRVAKNAERTEAYFESDAPPHLVALSESFVNGINAFIEKNPNRVPEWSLELKPWHALAIGNAMILRWPLGGIQDELRNTQNSNGFGSNQWSIAPERSAEGCAVLLTDPHLTWEGMAVFYEAHVHSDELEMHGFFLVGSPLLALGHNGHVGWAPTTGGPDTADIYEIKLNPENQLQYEYDGEWRDAKIEFISIPVKGQANVNRPAGFTHLGPLFSEPDREKNIAYVGATPYFESTGLGEQIYDMCRAKSAEELYAAMAQNEYFEQNIMFADRGGNIQYVRVGRVPVRPDGYDWTKAVPGHTSATAWKGLHPIEDLVQVRNPEQGYMQNCNISPGLMMKNSPMQPDLYPDYIYNVSWDNMNTRGMRALDLLSSDRNITKDEAKAIAFDVYDVLAVPWQNALRTAIFDTGGKYAEDDEFENMVQRVLEWNGQLFKDSKLPPVIMYWRRAVQDTVDEAAIATGQPLSKEDQLALLDGLAEAMDTIESTYGTLDITWGDIHKVGRGGRYFPVDGAVLGRGANRTRTLFNVGGKDLEGQPGVQVASNGSMSMVLMFFHEDGIESYTCIPWGQSADPKSPHYLDQAEKLYSQRKFKRVHQTKDTLMEKLESTTVLKTL